MSGHTYWSTYDAETLPNTNQSDDFINLGDAHFQFHPQASYLQPWEISGAQFADGNAGIAVSGTFSPNLTDANFGEVNMGVPGGNLTPEAEDLVNINSYMNLLRTHNLVALGQNTQYSTWGNYFNMSGNTPDSQARNPEEMTATATVHSERNLYAQAYEEWLSHEPSNSNHSGLYNPFGSDDIFLHPTMHTEVVHKPTDVSKETDTRAVGSKIAKPSFADVAKSNLKAVSNQRPSSPSIRCNFASGNVDANAVPSSKSKLGVSVFRGTPSSSQDDACSTTSTSSSRSREHDSISPPFKVVHKSRASDRQNGAKMLSSNNLDQASGNNILKPSKSGKKKKKSKIALFQSEHLLCADKIVPKCVPTKNDVQLNNTSAANKECFIDSIKCPPSQGHIMTRKAAGSILNEFISNDFTTDDSTKKNQKTTVPNKKQKRNQVVAQGQHSKKRAYPEMPKLQQAQRLCTQIIKIVSDTLGVWAQSISVWLPIAWLWIYWAGHQITLVVVAFLKLLLTVLALLCAIGAFYCVELWVLVKNKYKELVQPLIHRFMVKYGFRKEPAGGPDLSSWAPRRFKSGLKENIQLPTNGKEAIRRLLSFKDTDPYSVLGVRSDTSDEEIKKYYRKQAVLVHPDKNQDTEADEAFKVLANAFDLVGTEEKRKEYDNEFEVKDVETAKQEFDYLMRQVGEKLFELSNLINCNKCEGKHRRIPTDRSMAAARYCQRCDAMHACKDGDMWAESKYLGFLWHYYACMDSQVYEITEFASCQKEQFSTMESNSHQVFLRMANSGTTSRPTNDTAFNTFMRQFMQQYQTASPGGNEEANQASSHSQTRGRRRKRRQ